MEQTDSSDLRCQAMPGKHSRAGSCYHTMKRNLKLYSSIADWSGVKQSQANAVLLLQTVVWGIYEVRKR